MTAEKRVVLVALMSLAVGFFGARATAGDFGTEFNKSVRASLSAPRTNVQVVESAGSMKADFMAMRQDLAGLRADVQDLKMANLVLMDMIGKLGGVPPASPNPAEVPPSK